MEGVYVTGSAEETKTLAKKFAQELRGGITLCLRGQLAAGKTTFTQGLGEFYGIDRMTSPTYVIVHQYPIDHDGAKIKTFYHVDLYRLENHTEIKSFSIDELWEDKSNLIVVEWPERLEDHLPKSRYEINFRIISPDSREITFELI